VLILFWFSPLALVVTLLAAYLVGRQRWWHWWRIALGALAVIVAVVGLSGPWPAVYRHFYVPAHLWQYVALWAGFGPAGVRVNGWDLTRDLLFTQAPLAVPVGVLVGAILVRQGERAAGGAEWSPFVRRRQAVDHRVQLRRVDRALTRPHDGRCDAPALGVHRDGDLREWVQRRRYVVIPKSLRGHGMAVVGAPGSGKTVTLTRLVYAAAAAGKKITFADCKGTDPRLAEAIVGAYQAANPHARVALWPDMALDGWRGDLEQVASRLLQVQSYTEPYYKEAAGLAVRLALTAPGVAPVGDSMEFLTRLDADWLARMWVRDPLRGRQVESIRDAIPGTALRYANYFATVAGGFDGTWSHEDVDCSVLTVPSLASKDHADATIRMVLADWRHYVSRRKPRVGEDAALFLDEFGAIDGGPGLATDLLERARDVGGSVIVAGQSAESLGRDQWEVRRLLAACAGGVVIHRCPDPDELLRAAGTSGRPSSPGSSMRSAQAGSATCGWAQDEGQPGCRAPGRDGRGVGDPRRPRGPPACPAGTTSVDGPRP
jgi:hypothetical protein